MIRLYNTLNEQIKIALEGYCMYQKFQTVVELETNERAKGTDIAQQQFRDLQTRARDGNSSLL